MFPYTIQLLSRSSKQFNWGHVALIQKSEALAFLNSSLILIRGDWFFVRSGSKMEPGTRPKIGNRGLDTFFFLTTSFITLQEFLGENNLKFQSGGLIFTREHNLILILTLSQS